MVEEMVLDDDSLVDGDPDPRVAVALCLDTSRSMRDEGKIEKLNDGVKVFFDEVRSDEEAKEAVEVSVVTFGGSASKLLDFAPIDRQNVPSLSANGHTPMGEAVTMSLDLLDARKDRYKKAGIDYYQPWLVLMTDGQSNGEASVFEAAAGRTCSLVTERKLTVFPIAIGEDADIDQLKRFSPKRDPIRLKGHRFKEFFVWLSRSVERVSQSIPGDAVPLDTEGIKGWGEV